MEMKKGCKIHHVIINAGLTCAYSDDDKIIPTTRAQRKALADYKNPNYIENVKKAFNHPDPLDKEFSLYKGSERKI